MSRAVLILRPEPGAAATAARAAARRMAPIVVPLFEIAPRAWRLPELAFDAVLMTSANAARQGGPQLQALAHLPLYAVGEATAETARAAGFADVRVAGPDLMASFSRLRADRRAHVLHLAGEHRTPGDPGALRIHVEIVYAAEPIRPEPSLAGALGSDPVVLLHSRRAALAFRQRLAAEAIPPAGLRVAAISPAVAEALGEGWRALRIAPEPIDDALLEVAARMCD